MVENRRGNASIIVALERRAAAEIITEKKVKLDMNFSVIEESDGWSYAIPDRKENEFTESTGID